VQGRAAFGGAFCFRTFHQNLPSCPLGRTLNLQSVYPAHAIRRPGIVGVRRRPPHDGGAHPKGRRKPRALSCPARAAPWTGGCYSSQEVFDVDCQRVSNRQTGCASPAVVSLRAHPMSAFPPSLPQADGLKATHGGRWPFLGIGSVRRGRVMSDVTDHDPERLKDRVRKLVKKEPAEKPE
jgi:hypothetical protein